MRYVVILVVLLVVVAVLVITGIVPRLRASRALAAETNELAAPTVLVVQPKPGAPSQEIVLPGNIEAFVDSPIFARTNGYLKRWYFDIGSHVKQGQLLAEIESPEIDHELSQAQADLGTAQANEHLSEITANRFSDLIKQDAVSQQDTDNAVSDLAARKTAVKSAQANVDRLRQLVAFEKVYAPFDGVVTARNTDIGQLIDSGAAGGPPRSLFQMAAINRLRVFISVPQIYSQAATPGLTADLMFAEFPGRRFPGKLVRTSRAIDPVARTLNVEVDVDNAKGELFPGAYTEVHLKLKDGLRPTLIIPVSALLFRREGLEGRCGQERQHRGVIADYAGARLRRCRRGHDRTDGRGTRDLQSAGFDHRWGTAQRSGREPADNWSGGKGWRQMKRLRDISPHRCLPRLRWLWLC